MKKRGLVIWVVTVAVLILAMTFVSWRSGNAVVDAGSSLLAKPIFGSSPMVSFLIVAIMVGVVVFLIERRNWIEGVPQDG